MDIVSGSWPGDLFLFPRRPNGTYGAPKALRYADGSKIKVGSATAVAAADWNQDSITDLLVGDIGGFVHLVLNTGTATRPNFEKGKRLKAGGRTIKVSKGDAGPAVADWDSDGLQDLIVGTGAGDVLWFRNTQSATDPLLAAGEPLIKGSPTKSDDLIAFDNPTHSGLRTKINIVDWNQDGAKDLIVGDFNATRVDSTSKYHGWVWVYLRKSDQAKAARDLN